MNKYIMSLSAVNVDSCKAFLKTLAILFQSYDIKYTSAQRKYLLIQSTQADDFARQFKLTKLKKAAVDLVAAGKNPSKDDTTDEAISDLLLQLKPLKAKFDKETDISREELSLLNDFRLAQFGSEAAMKRIDKNISSLGDTKITTLFVDETFTLAHMKDVYAQYDKLIAKHGGAAEGAMPLDLLKKWAATHKTTGKRKADHAKYLALRKEINDAQKAAIKQVVRSAATDLVDVRDLVQVLKQKGIRNSIPTGFVGKMDDAGKFYTTEGKQLVANPAGEVRMNPRYDAKLDNAYVCEFTPPFGGAAGRAYTKEYRAGSKTNKFELVESVLPRLDTLSKKWLPGIKKLGESREALIAVLCEYIFTTSSRVSNKNAKTDGETTYGATTLKVKHVKKSAGGYTVTYIGKSSGRQKHVLKANTARGKILCAAIGKLLEGKSPKDNLFEYNGKIVSGTLITKYLIKIGFPTGFTIHMLRTAKGTKLTKELLSKSPFKKGGDWKDIEVHRWLEKELLKVGSELGHMSGTKVTANTAIQNYIAPNILIEFYKKLGIRPSAKIQKAIDAAGKADKK